VQTNRDLSTGGAKSKANNGRAKTKTNAAGEATNSRRNQNAAAMHLLNTNHSEERVLLAGNYSSAVQGGVRRVKMRQAPVVQQQQQQNSRG